ncbi:MAG: DUF3575 domain-containing protein [Spirochaetota bacterium]|nr:DUF3575 domain-containing protein [Spirochaetota bacterium]
MKRLFLILLCLFCIGVIPVFSSAQEMGVELGLGYSYAMGDMGDIVNPIIPVLFSFQYALIPNLSLELDTFYEVYSSRESNVLSYTLYQLGAGMRFWFSKAYTGLYAGAGVAYTHQEIETENRYWDGSGFWKYEGVNESDDMATLCAKVGYSLSLSETLSADIGIRYDAIDIDNFADQPLTFYIGFIYLL